MKRIISTLICFWSMLSATSCIKDGSAAGCSSCEGQELNVNVSLEETRSGYSCNEDKITSFHILAFSNGYLVNFKSIDGDPRSQSIRMTLLPGNYDCYAIANVPTFDPEMYPDKENLESLAIDTDGNTFDIYGYPMAWSSPASLTGKTADMTVRLERLVSRWELAVNTSALPELRLTSARIRCAAAAVYPFGKNSDVATIDGDVATTEDIALLNDGGTAVFYVPENRQGNLLEGNDDPYLKNYENLKTVVGKAKADLCTYIELGAQIVPISGSEPPYEGSITYRFYLGSDHTSNFDIVRNTGYEVTFIPTAGSPDSVRPDGGEIIWKVEPDIIKYEYDTEYCLELSKTTLSSDGEEFTCTVTAQRKRNGNPFGSPADVSDDFSFSSSDDAISMSGPTGRLSATPGSQGSAKITATGSNGATCSAIISWQLEGLSSFSEYVRCEANPISASGGSSTGIFIFRDHVWSRNDRDYVVGEEYEILGSTVSADSRGTTEGDINHIGTSILLEDDSPDGIRHECEIWQEANTKVTEYGEWGSWSYSGSLSAYPTSFSSDGGDGSVNVSGVSASRSRSRWNVYSSGATENLSNETESYRPDYDVDTDNPDWISVDRYGFTVEANPSSSSRRGYINLYVGGMEIDYVIIRQDGYTATITTEVEWEVVSAPNIPADGGASYATFRYRVLTYTDGVLTATGNWDTQRGSAVSAGANTSTSERFVGTSSATVSGTTMSAEIYQDGKAVEPQYRWIYDSADSAGDIPASGGTSYGIFTYKEQVSRDGGSTWSDTGSTHNEAGTTVSAGSRGTTKGNRTLAGTSTIAAASTPDGIARSVRVYQEANEMREEERPAGETIRVNSFSVSPTTIPMSGGYVSASFSVSKVISYKTYAVYTSGAEHTTATGRTESIDATSVCKVDGAGTIGATNVPRTITVSLIYQPTNTVLRTATVSQGL